MPNRGAQDGDDSVRCTAGACQPLELASKRARLTKAWTTMTTNELIARNRYTTAWLHAPHTESAVKASSSRKSFGIWKWMNIINANNSLLTPPPPPVPLLLHYGKGGKVKERKKKMGPRGACNPALRTEAEMRRRALLLLLKFRVRL